MPLTTVFTSPGTYTIDDDGIRGNNISVVRDSAGVVIQTFVHPADTMNFSVITPGVNLIFNALDSFGSANVTVGHLTDAAQSPDSIVVKHLRTDGFMTLVSNGSITEGGADAPADIIAAAVVLSAATGIGTAANAIDTQTTFIEAETNTGGINIANAGLVQIGGITPDVDGLDVATSGDLNFSSVGFIYMADTSGPEMLHGGDSSGNVTLTAIGSDADIYSTIDAVTARAAGGGVTLNAGRDVLAGIGGTNYNNDILATTFVDIHAGRDFILDGTSNIRTGAFGGVVGGPIDIQAGRNISLANTTGGLQTIEAFNGNVTLTTGPGGAFTESANFPGAVQTTNDIILTADTVQILSGGLNTTGVGSVTVRPATPGRAIDIGSAIDPFATLALSDAEFDLLFTLNVNIGDANSGPVEFTAPISPFIVDNIDVRSAAEIFVRSSITLPRSLTLRAGDDLYFSATGSFTSTLGGFTGFVDEAQGDGGVGGVGNLGGSIAVTGAINLVGNNDNDSLNGGSGPDMLQGLGGNDMLRGGPGADTMAGGAGDDLYFVDNASDTVIEALGNGDDRIFTSVSYTLPGGANGFIEKLTTTDNGGTGAINLTGNEFANAIYGNGGANILDGAGGADTLLGLSGNDWYYVDNAGDQVADAAGQGTLDRVFAAVSYTLAAGAQIEILSTTNHTGTGSINLTGNEFVDTIIGNDGNNILDGKAGADFLQGRLGNDWYYVDDTGDQIVESAGQGTLDRVFASVSYALPSGAEIEALSTTDRSGTSPINLTGNALGDTISGNGGSNALVGLGGNDTLIGNAGADAFVFNTALGAGNVDHIVDFNYNAALGDQIVLHSGIFTALAPGALPAGTYRIGTAALDADDRIIYNPNTGELSYDADGLAGAADVRFAILDNLPNLANTQFLVV